MRLCSLFAALVCAITSSWTACAADDDKFKVGPTVREVVEFTQILQPLNHSVDALREQISSDGSKAFIVTRKANVANDSNRYDILLLQISHEKFSRGVVSSPEVILSFDVTDDHSYGLPAIKDARWVDERTITFLGRFSGDYYQVYRLDIQTRKFENLTQETNPIVSYAASRNGRRVVYAIQVPNPPVSKGGHSLIADKRTLWSIVLGQHDIRMQERRYRYFVSDMQSQPTRKPLGEAFNQQNLGPPSVSISPDGRWALLPVYEPKRTLAWAHQYPLVAELTTLYSNHVDPEGYFSQPNGYASRRMLAWQLDDCKAHTVVDAPDDAFPAGGQFRSDRLWLNDGASVILAGTHLPQEPGKSVSPASHVIEYWPDNGRWRSIATLNGRLGEAHATKEGFFVIDNSKRRDFTRDSSGDWRENESSPGAMSNRSSTWKLEVAEGLNEPPNIVATGPSGQSVKLTHFNPQFDPKTWGDMRPYSWQDSKGRRWDGGLMVPQGIDAKTRLPLVIQTYGFSQDRFYLDGTNLFNGASSGFAGRAFLREGLLVLALPWRSSTDAPKTELESIRAFADGVRGAIDALAKAGRIDPQRVAIMGWSATGERVLNLITFDDVPIRSASMLDGDSNTLLAYINTYGASDTIWKLKEDVNEGQPYGEKFASWIRNDSSLHTACIKAAVRIESYGSWVSNNWDIYALLRRQFKPVEMIVIPDGAHSLAQPSERMLSLQGNVDWHSFWLTGRQRTTPLLPEESPESLRHQYESWSRMEVMKAADDARPRCSSDVVVRRN